MTRSGKILLPVIVLAGLLVTWYVLPRPVLGYHSGAPSGYSGSPVDARTCATPGCHDGPPVDQNGWITSDVPPEGYLPGQSYTLTFTATRPGVAKYGFQASPVDSMKHYAGTFALSDPQNTQLGTGFHYVTHTAQGSSGMGTRTWTATWTAPNAYPLWPVTIYGAFVAGDSLGNDSVYHSTLRLVPKNMAIGEQERRNTLKLLQDPKHSSVLILTRSEAMLRVFDTTGRLLWSRAVPPGESKIPLPVSWRGIVWISLESKEGKRTISGILP